jgi:phosphohistidine phosphatase
MSSLLSGARMEAKKVIHSGALRAQQTLEILQWATSSSGSDLEAREGLGPQDPVDPWVREIEGWTEEAIVVCHHPFIGRLASTLVAGREDPVVFSFVPGTALCLEKGAAGWSAAWMIPPGAVAGLGRY